MASQVKIIGGTYAQLTWSARRSGIRSSMLDREYYVLRTFSDFPKHEELHARRAFTAFSIVLLSNARLRPARTLYACLLLLGLRHVGGAFDY